MAQSLELSAAYGSHHDPAHHYRRPRRRRLGGPAPRDRRPDRPQLRRDDGPLRGGRRRHRCGGAHRQGRGPRRHRLQERGGHPLQRALDPQVGQPERGGRDRRGGRRPRPHQGGPGRPPDPLQEACPLRARLAPHRGGGRVRRAGPRLGHRGRQGRPDRRPRGARLPARLARRHPPRARTSTSTSARRSSPRSSSSTARATTSC